MVVIYRRPWDAVYLQGHTLTNLRAMTTAYGRGKVRTGSPLRVLVVDSCLFLEQLWICP